MVHPSPLVFTSLHLYYVEIMETSLCSARENISLTPFFFFTNRLRVISVIDTAACSRALFNIDNTDNIEIHHTYLIESER